VSAGWRRLVTACRSMLGSKRGIAAVVGAALVVSLFERAGAACLA
jgi:hypothetical protein